MKEKLSLIGEIQSVLKNENIKEYIDEHANGLQHRLTPMIIGLFLDNTDRKAVDTWLYQMGEDRINPRNPYEAIFLFVFEKYSNCFGEEKVERWQILYNEYKEKIKDSMVSKEFSLIITFGDLCESIKRDSEEEVSAARTYATKNYTNSVIYPELEKAINNTSDTDVVAFGKYLDFLQDDPSIASYQRKATYYLRKFLYESIMSGIYLLYDRHQYAYTKEKNKKIRESAFSSYDSFNTYISCNGICLDKIKAPKPIGIDGEIEEDKKKEKRKKNKEKRSTELKRTLKYVLGYSSETDSVSLEYESCKRFLSEKNIAYSTLISSFYEMFGGYGETPIEYKILKHFYSEEENTLADMEYQEYEFVRSAFVKEKSDMPLLEPGEEYIPEYDTTGTVQFLIGKYLSFKEKNNKNTYLDIIKKMLSGERNTTRRMLLLFGLYAGYTELSLNGVLEKCGYEKLSKYSNFDKTIILLAKSNFIQRQKELYNDEKYLLTAGKINERIDQKDDSNLKAYFEKKYGKKADSSGGLIKKAYRKEIEFEERDYFRDLIDQYILIEVDDTLPSVSDILHNEWKKNVMIKESRELKDLEEKHTLNKLMLKK